MATFKGTTCGPLALELADGTLVSNIGRNESDMATLWVLWAHMKGLANRPPIANHQKTNAANRRF